MRAASSRGRRPLVDLERAGALRAICTQNFDDLQPHTVLELHGGILATDVVMFGDGPPDGVLEAAVEDASRCEVFDRRPIDTALPALLQELLAG